MVEYKDLLQQTIRLGDHIAYVTRDSTNPIIRLATVVALKVSKRTWISEAEEPILLVRAFGQDWNNEWEALTKLVTLTKLDRVIVLYHNQLGPKLLTMLDENVVETTDKK